MPSASLGPDLFCFFRFVFLLDFVDKSEIAPDLFFSHLFFFSQHPSRSVSWRREEGGKEGVRAKQGPRVSRTVKPSNGVEEIVYP